MTYELIILEKRTGKAWDVAPQVTQVKHSSDLHHQPHRLPGDAEVQHHCLRYLLRIKSRNRWIALSLRSGGRLLNSLAARSAISARSQSRGWAKIISATDTPRFSAKSSSVSVLGLQVPLR